MNRYRKLAEDLSVKSTLTLDNKFYSYHGMMHEHYVRYSREVDNHNDRFGQFVEFQVLAREIKSEISDELLLSFGMDDLPSETDDNAYVTFYLRNTLADMAALAMKADRLSEDDFNHLSGFILHFRKEIANDQLMLNRTATGQHKVTASQRRLAMTLKHSAPFLEPFQQMLSECKRDKQNPLSRHMKRKINSALLAILYVNWLQKKAGVKVTGLSDRHRRNLVGMIKGMSSFRQTGLRLNKMPRFLNRLSKDVSRLLKAATRLSPSLTRELGLNFAPVMSQAKAEAIQNDVELKSAYEKIDEQQKLIGQQRYEMAALEIRLSQDRIRSENLRHQLDMEHYNRVQANERQRQIDYDYHQEQKNESSGFSPVTFIKRAIVISVVLEIASKRFGHGEQINTADVQSMAELAIKGGALDEMVFNDNVSPEQIDINELEVVIESSLERIAPDLFINEDFEPTKKSRLSFKM
ncbi:hypothetical protein VCHA53O466_40124 [Vibrio chagasii]|nr:hypothetical protein VCHA53O466_40124 [Vibrio chagasii]